MRPRTWQHSKAVAPTCEACWCRRFLFYRLPTAHLLSTVLLASSRRGCVDAGIRGRECLPGRAAVQELDTTLTVLGIDGKAAPAAALRKSGAVPPPRHPPTRVSSDALSPRALARSASEAALRCAAMSLTVVFLREPGEVLFWSRVIVRLKPQRDKAALRCATMAPSCDGVTEPVHGFCLTQPCPAVIKRRGMPASPCSSWELIRHAGRQRRCERGQPQQRGAARARSRAAAQRRHAAAPALLAALPGRCAPARACTACALLAFRCCVRGTFVYCRASMRSIVTSAHQWRGQAVMLVPTLLDIRSETRVSPRDRAPGAGSALKLAELHESAAAQQVALDPKCRHWRSGGQRQSSGKVLQGSRALSCSIEPC